jgi:hypothetical protein
VPRKRLSLNPAPVITLRAIKHAHSVFLWNEPRDLFYRAATELIALARNGKTSLTIGEALAVLLQTWNSAYYRFHKFDALHFKKIERLCQKHQTILATKVDCWRLANTRRRAGGL